MRKYILILLIFTIPAVLLAACSSSNSDPAAKAVEEYFKALVTRDADRLQTLVCPDWEDQALLALDSLQAVTPRLEDLSCEQAGSGSDAALVKCNGKLIATYNNEDQEIDLSLQTYQVTKQGSDWLVCGTQ